MKRSKILNPHLRTTGLNGMDVKTEEVPELGAKPCTTTSLENKKQKKNQPQQSCLLMQTVCLIQKTKTRPHHQTKELKTHPHSAHYYEDGNQRFNRKLHKDGDENKNLFDKTSKTRIKIEERCRRSDKKKPYNMMKAAFDQVNENILKDILRWRKNFSKSHCINSYSTLLGVLYIIWW